MFDIGFSELIVIALVALIVFGPKRLPEMARAAGYWMGRIRRFMDNVKQDLDREMNTGEMAEFKKLQEELAAMRESVHRQGTQTLERIGRDLDGETRSVLGESGEVPSEHGHPSLPAPGDISGGLNPEARTPAGKKRTTKKRAVKKRASPAKQTIPKDHGENH